MLSGFRISIVLVGSINRNYIGAPAPMPALIYKAGEGAGIDL
jgi:hypothetical protein